MTSVSPLAGATGVPTNTAVKATFSQAMDATSITSSTFVLRNAANSVVTGAVTYDSTSNTTTLQPSAALATSTTYTATVSGGKWCRASAADRSRSRCLFSIHGSTLPSPTTMH